MSGLILFSFFFFFNDTATTEIYTLSLHDALPIFFLKAQRKLAVSFPPMGSFLRGCRFRSCKRTSATCGKRSEEHTSELQSQSNLVCRLLLEKKTTIQHTHTAHDNVMVSLDLAATS